MRGAAAFTLLIAGLGLLFLGLRQNKTTVQGVSLGGGNWGALTVLTLDHFQPWEFGRWFSDMSPELLKKLDHFRELWGAPVTVSPVEGGVGRHLGADDTSQHNVDRWGEVRAIDIFPEGLNASNKARAIRLAKQAGFSGVGVYSDTSPGWMMHVDVRLDRSARNPATWGRVSDAIGLKRYVGIGEVV